MQKAKVGFQQDSVTDKIQKTDVILKSMDGNASFPAAQPMLAPMRATVKALTDKMQAVKIAQDTGKQLVSEQNQIESDLDGELANLCSDVNREADGDESKLISSGFELSKAATAAGVPGAVTDFSLSRGDNPGVVDGHCHTVKNARAYESRFVVAAMPEGDWQSGPTFFNSKFEWTGLVSGSTIWVEVRASGTAGAGPWSDAVSIVVG